MRRAAALLAAPLLIAAASPTPVPPRDERGRADADCRAVENGPAVRVAIDGLKDRQGLLVVELYPANDDDFLASDKLLIASGKPFRRVSAPPPPAGSARLCIRAPGAGRYALFVLHDRDGDRKFGVLRDGAGFANNPRLGRSKPRAEAAAILLGPAEVPAIRIVMNYRRGLGFGPLEIAREARR